jgi:hypothetical protein
MVDAPYVDVELSRCWRRHILYLGSGDTSFIWEEDIWRALW